MGNRSKSPGSSRKKQQNLGFLISFHGITENEIFFHFDLPSYNLYYMVSYLKYLNICRTPCHQYAWYAKALVQKQKRCDYSTSVSCIIAQNVSQ